MLLAVCLFVAVCIFITVCVFVNRFAGGCVFVIFFFFRLSVCGCVFICGCGFVTVCL